MCPHLPGAAGERDGSRTSVLSGRSGSAAEVWRASVRQRQADEDRRLAGLDLLCMLLEAEGVDIFDAPMHVYIRIDQAVDRITEAAAEALFAPVVAAAAASQ